MNMSILFKAQAASSYVRNSRPVQRVVGAFEAAESLRPADAPVERLPSSAAQLSSLGQLKSAVAQAQFGAHALANLPRDATGADVSQTSEQFVGTFNTAVDVAKATLAGQDAAAIRSASRVGGELMQAVSMDAGSIETLKNAGFSMSTHGNLALNASKLESAYEGDRTTVRETLVKWGHQVENSAAQELAGDAPMGDPSAPLQPRLSAPGYRRNALRQYTANAGEASAILS
jgi:predicted O-linked N-acetylglucosamine transferase (SPINDLY family)